MNMYCNIISKIVKSSVKHYSNTCQNNNIGHFNPFKKRFRNKFENDSKIATRMCLTIIGNGGIGQPRCVALFTDLKAFFFNCGEGVGRLCREYEVDIYQIRDVFITHKSWKNLSGLPDIYLTNEVIGVPRMNIYGPPDIEHFTSLLTSYKNGLKIKKKNEYIDENMQISCIEINSEKESSDIVNSYVCKIFKRLGDLDHEKCVELGVPIGPDLLALKNGEDVILPSGRIIRSADVLESVQQSITFLVVECPSESFLDSFVMEEKFLNHQLPADDSSEVNFIFHFTPPKVMQSEKYKNWMQKFHQCAQHYILNTSNASVSSGAVNQTQNVLHLLHPEIFKLLPIAEENEVLNLPVSTEVEYPPPMLQIYLRPQKKLSWQNVVKYNSEDYSKMLEEFTDFNSVIQELKQNISKQRHPPISEYPEVLILGTSSATSTAFRNVSSILIHINPHKSILLDCGEGTFLQMVRYFGKSEVYKELTKICCIFITHQHTDHYMGLFQILASRKEAFEVCGLPPQPVTLILPPLINVVLKRFCDIFRIPKPNVKLISCKSFTSVNKSSDVFEEILGDVELLTVPVIHCPEAYGIVLQLGSKWKIVYSGDTSPCQALIEAGKNCNLLIHEASVEDNLASEAQRKLHCTPSQVVDVAEKMNAQFTMMTHFSKRYLGVPIFQESHQRNVGIAFDFMKVKLHNLPILPLFLPALKCLFEEQWETHLEKSSTTKQTENVFLRTYRSFRSR